MAGFGPRYCGSLERLTLSALPAPWAHTEWASPVDRSQLALTVKVRKEQRAEVRRILSRRKGVGVKLRSHHGQAFRSGLRSDLLAEGAGQGLDRGLGLSFCI